MSDDLTDDGVGQEPVGGLAEETVKLIAALAAQATGGAPSGGEAQDRSDSHECPNGWCPVCQFAAFMRDNPEIVDQVVQTAVVFGRTLKEAFDLAMDPRDTP